jgi:hypothetical protein
VNTQTAARERRITRHRPVPTARQRLLIRRAALRVGLDPDVALCIATLRRLDRDMRAWQTILGESDPMSESARQRLMVVERVRALIRRGCEEARR